ncbi:MAG TPA: glycosyltransferase, partial [Streptosporangiaceae bacterium]
VPVCLPTLLAQDYGGKLSIVLVDDDSTDGTADAGRQAAKEAGWTVTETAPGQAEAARTGNAVAVGGDRHLTIVRGQPAPPGWAGKVWAMSQGVSAAGPAAVFLLFTDADIAYAEGTVTALATAAGAGQYALVSQMALLRARARWEKVLVPAFVYFFMQLYPFRRVNNAGRKTAAAAGGCMLVRADALAAAGGLDQIRAARIDDVAFGTLLKRTGARCWLGLSTDVTSLRPYDRLADIWNMVARSAFTQLRYSVTLTVGTVLGLAWLYLLPPAALVAGVLLLGAGASAPTAAWLAAAGFVGWLAMSVTYVPMLRLYRLAAWRAVGLPIVAGLYGAMTADSARRHLGGRGGEWKGRVID